MNNNFSNTTSIKEQAQKVRKASIVLRNLSHEQRNAMLRAIKEALTEQQAEIYKENKNDVADAQKQSLCEALVKRLVFDEAKLKETCAMIDAVIALPNKIYMPLAHRELAPNLILTQRLVPLGVIGMIFESRPDALIQIAILCIKSGNGIILKGGSEAHRTNVILARIICNVAQSYAPNILYLLETRKEVSALISLTNEIDILIPRGSKEFVSHIIKNSTIPVMGHADGVCHMYIHKDADLSMTREVLKDSKMQYPAVCNALECVVLHTKLVVLLPFLFRDLVSQGLIIHADENEAAEILTQAEVANTTATEEDWGREYLHNELAVKIVNDEHEAVSFINRYSSGHTESIITQDEKLARFFQRSIDSASVFWNCSTRLADGYRYGLGAEVGISTSRIHARGPVGVDGLFTTQWVLDGAGHTVAPFIDGTQHFTHKELPLQ